jgi:hypothetical protein
MTATGGGRGFGGNRNEARRGVVWIWGGIGIGATDEFGHR